ncbi:hypothetical protein TUM20903_39450 [Citrobacter koseri]|nr:hypothetical protein TUM20903_39450 [Citrobacter koseri]
MVLLVCSVLVPAYADGWYINKRGEPTVMSEDGYWYMILSKTVQGDVNIYLLPRNKAECRSSGRSSSMFVNGTKLRWWQNCDANMGMYWYAYTQAGINHIIGEFIRRQTVTIRDGNLTILFSAMGFNSTARQFIDELSNPGL